MLKSTQIIPARQLNGNIMKINSLINNELR